MQTPRSLSIASALAVVAACGCAHGQGTVTKEVLVGDPIPGGSDHFTQFGHPYITEDGDIVFSASGSQTSGIWMKRRLTGQIVSVVKVGDSVPLPSGTGTVSAVGLNPGMNRSRQVAFRAAVASPAQGGGIWVRNTTTNTSTLVAFDGQTAPNTPGPATFANLAVFTTQFIEDREAQINRQGSVLFEGDLSDGGFGAWARVGTTLTKVVQYDLPPLVVPNITLATWKVQDFFAYTINRNDKIALIAQAVSPPAPPAPSQGYYALWIGDPGTAPINVWSGIGLGGVFATGQFALEWSTSLDALNIASFAADRITAKNNVVLFTQTWSMLSNSRFLVAQSCDKEPYVGGGAAVLYNGAALFLFQGDFDGDDFCEWGLGYSDDDQGLPVTVAYTGEVLFHGPNLPVVTGIGPQFALNREQRFAFLGNSGPSPVLFGGVAPYKQVYYGIGTNDTILVPIGGGVFDPKTVTDIIWGGASSEFNFAYNTTENGLGMMSDCGLGTVVFGLEFDDGASGIFTYQIPHPGDINFDGMVNSQDFFDFLGWFNTGDGRADFNRDGVVNSQDLFDYLAAAGTTPEPCPTS